MDDFNPCNAAKRWDLAKFSATRIHEKTTMNSPADHALPEQPKYGARVYRIGNKILVKQTVLQGTPPEYVIDRQREKHVLESNDSEIANAIRDALSGQL